MELLGELAAVGTSLVFSVGSTLFTLSGRRLGSGVVNRTRLALALLFTMCLHLLLVGSLYPFNAPPEAFFWMGLSGFVGYVIGDAFLFQAFVMVGPRLSMLMMALAPVLSALMAWIFLHEGLGAIQVIGILITIGGLGLVVGSPHPGEPSETPHEDRRTYLIGLAMGFGAACGQAGGSLLSKIGLSGGLPAISGNAIRLTAAVILIWLYAIGRKQIGITYRALRKDQRGLLFVVLGTCCGPVIGVWLALTSVQLAPLGVVTTLQSLPPIFLIPISYFVFKERITRMAVMGTVIAIGGSLLLFVK